MQSKLEASGAPRRRCPSRLASVRHAADGFRHLLRSEPNARIHLAATLAVAAAAVELQVTLADGRWLVLAAALVWIAEAFNTALERLCDAVHPDRADWVRIVKDSAAAGVLVSALAAAAIGAATLLPYAAAALQGLPA